MNQKLESILAEPTSTNRSIETMAWLNLSAADGFLIGEDFARGQFVPLVEQLRAMIHAEPEPKPETKWERMTVEEIYQAGVAALDYFSGTPEECELRSHWVEALTGDPQAVAYCGGMRFGIRHAEDRAAPVVEALEAERDLLKVSGLLLTEEIASLKAEVERLREHRSKRPIMSKYHGPHGFEREDFIRDYTTWSALADAPAPKAEPEPAPSLSNQLYARRWGYHESSGVWTRGTDQFFTYDNSASYIGTEEYELVPEPVTPDAIDAALARLRARVVAQMGGAK